MLVLSGSDGAAHTQDLEDNLDLYALKSKIINVTTVNGTERKNYERRKIKIRAKEGYIRNYDSIKINSISKEEAMVEKYESAAKKLLLWKSKTRTTADTATLGIEKSKVFISYSESRATWPHTSMAGSQYKHPI